MLNLNSFVSPVLAALLFVAQGPAQGQPRKSADPLRNGTLIGAGIGAGLATWDYLIDPSEPGNAVIFGVSIGLGAAIGAGIDALLSRSGRAPDASPGKKRLILSPFAGKERQGALIAVRF